AGSSSNQEVFAAFEGENFDLDELIEKAQAEGPITIYDNASAVEDIAANFSEKYGIEATGTKVDAAEAQEMVTREAQSGEIVGDVVTMQDLPALRSQLLPNDFVSSWIPEDARQRSDESLQEPEVLVSDANPLTGKDGVDGTGAITNIWELADEQWQGNVALEDPVGANKVLVWFSQMDLFDEDTLVAA